MDLITAFRKYVEYEDKSAEEFLVHELYKNTQYWINHHEPKNQFIIEFLELIFEYETEDIQLTSLLELGIEELMDALNYFNGFEKQTELVEKHLYQALMAFLAYIDEENYRKLKQIQFFESDFYIFDIIGGEFPHESAQLFLKTTSNIDVWTTIKYLEEVNDLNTIVEILGSLLNNLKILPDKYILLSYFIIKYPEQVGALFGDVKIVFLNFVNLPKDIHFDEIKSIYFASKEFLFYRKLKINFYEKILHPKHESIVLLSLLTMFEITNADLTPAWIEVFERSIGNLWSYKNKTFTSQRKHQPLPEFAINIISFLSEEEQKIIYETSKIWTIFFENIHRYSRQTFDELIDSFSFYPEIFEEELRSHLYLGQRSNLILKRLNLCASKMQKKIVFNGNHYELMDDKEL